jgi:hypothetical protein
MFAGKRATGSANILPAGIVVRWGRARERLAIFGTEWTQERVAERLIEAFRAMRGIPIYSPRKGAFDPFRPVDGLDLISAVQKILGRESPACFRLFGWARTQANGDSFRELCRESGRARSTAYYRRARTLTRIAAVLNAAGTLRAACAPAPRNAGSDAVPAELPASDPAA